MHWPQRAAKAYVPNSLPCSNGKQSGPLSIPLDRMMTLSRNRRSIAYLQKNSPRERGSWRTATIGGANATRRVFGQRLRQHDQCRCPAWGHFRANAPQQTTLFFNHLVGEREQRRRDIEAKRLS